MAVENLQDLAAEIINNGVSLSAINYVYITLVALVSSALGAYFGSYFKSRGAEKALQDSFDDVKERLRQTTRLTEEIKSSIELGTLEHQIKFSKLHEKRVEIIEGLYHRLIAMESEGKAFVYKSSPTRSDQAQFNTANSAINEFISYSRLNKFWVERSLFDEIETVALRLDEIIYGAVFNCDVNPQNTQQFEQAMEERRRLVGAINNEIPAAKEKIIDSIRKVLEPSRN
ncbi:hypothetical protein [Thioalkalivibrio sp. ALMg9]|uniref:hypothetical protein n=1 Tax=Thioalkalivibrio sp. ALMg9 TaxID=1266912 RepID=UPI0012DCEFF0|nr:hypothetical protein [Thioalkalivibrio sp. ALMg9]